MRSRPLVYIADLRYNLAGALSTDCMPLGVAYIKAALDRDVPEVDSRLFVYAEKLLEAMRADAPDVLMCSNYLWNESLSHYFLRTAKELRPDCLTVLGGPNIHLEPERQKDYVAGHPWLDVYLLGEGEFTSVELLRRYLDNGLSASRLMAAQIPSSLHRDPDNNIILEEMWKRSSDVDDVPSPWLTGIQDEFFDGKLAPMIETNRGCPFQCTFCVQGVNWYTKVHYFSLDRIREELNYVARKVRERSPAMGMLRIADSNYGMFERDIEISAHIGKLQREFGWPTFIDVTTGKNRPDRVIKSVEEASGATVVYMAVQSLDENVLRNVKRQNIKLEAYEQLRMYMRGRGLRSNSDLILCLPGETLESHVKALDKLLDHPIDQMHNLQLLLLKGSELETLESRRMFRFDARYRLGPKNYGIFHLGEHEEKVFDIEEIVVSTDTLSLDDYIHCRKLHLICSVFWNDSWFEQAFRLTDRYGIRRSEVFHRFLPELEADPEGKRFLDAFIGETMGELFLTPEALREHYNRQESFERLLRGDAGENLMYKYRAMASFFIWPRICAIALRAFRGTLIEHGAAGRIEGFEPLWDNFHRYMELQHAHGPDMDRIAQPVRGRFTYDIGAWIDAGLPDETTAFRLPSETEMEFALTEAGEQGLRAAFLVWSSRIQGLAKLVTRIKLEWQVRRTVAAPAADPALYETAAAGSVMA